MYNKIVIRLYILLNYTCTELLKIVVHRDVHMHIYTGVYCHKSVLAIFIYNIKSFN